MRLDLAGALAYLCLRLGHDRLNIEVIKTGLDALAGIRPLLLGHMRPGIPHPSAVSDGAVMQVRLWAERRPLWVFSWGHRLRAGDGSEMSGCRLAILGQRLLQTIRQYWSEEGLVQLPDWSRL
jgi:hypothetical protein